MVLPLVFRYEEEAGNLYSSDDEGSSSESDEDVGVSLVLVVTFLLQEARGDAADWLVNPESLLGAKTVHGQNKMTKKQEKILAVKEGRESKDHFKNRDRRGGTTNKEKRRNKPMMMGMNSERKELFS